MSKTQAERYYESGRKKNPPRRKITKYFLLAKTVHENGTTILFQLENDVNEMIERGWQPIGGVSVTNNMAAQALVMYE